jgi:hypothetical protein
MNPSANFSFFIVVLLNVWGIDFAWSKGLDKLAPAVPAETVEPIPPKNDQTTVEPAKPSVESPAAAEVTANQSKSPNPSMLRDNIIVSTSMGWISTNQDGVNWRSSGISDFTVSYKIRKVKIKDSPIYATFRYAPRDVAPRINKNDETHEYKGVIEGYHFGASYYWPLRGSMSLLAATEIGLLSPHLKREFNAAEEPPKDLGFQFGIGAGLEWKLLDNVSIGPRILYGAGSFNSLQFSGLASFAF